MKLELFNQYVFNKYKSNSQIIRVLSEEWFLNQMYCPCCLNLQIKDFPNNTKGYDFFCTNCNNKFQLKSSKNKFKKKVLDGEYKTMRKIILNNTTPNFFLLNYNVSDWHIKHLLFIPKFFINFSMLEKRKPLSVNARRVGWVGCNLLIERLPNEGKIPIIQNEKILEKEEINKVWRKMFFLNSKKTKFRGWTSDVLKIIDDLPRKFSIGDVYKYEKYLLEIYPSNNNIKAKIRQQLQILRDNKIIKFLSNGNYLKV